MSDASRKAATDGAGDPGLFDDGTIDERQESKGLRRRDPSLLATFRVSEQGKSVFDIATSTIGRWTQSGQNSDQGVNRGTNRMRLSGA